MCIRDSALTAAAPRVDPRMASLALGWPPLWMKPKIVVQMSCLLYTSLSPDGDSFARNKRKSAALICLKPYVPIPAILLPLTGTPKPYNLCLLYTSFMIIFYLNIDTAFWII